MALFWRIFAVNALLLTAAVIVLAFTPLTVSNPITETQLVLLGVGLLVLLLANLLLLRFSLRPLADLTQLMGRIDLLQPGDRLKTGGAAELSVVRTAFNEMLDRLEGERRVSSSRAVGREEDERRRVAAELHDQVGQGLTALLLQLRTALDDLPTEARGSLLEAQAIARENLDEVRRIARQLRPTVLDDLGLPYALMALADTLEESADIVVHRTIDVAPPSVPSETQLAIYRVAQEAMTNVARHSGASTVDVVFVPDDERRTLRLEVSDDGRGMIYVAGVEAGGIRGMRERAVAVGARLAIRTRPGGGTTVAMSVDVA